MRRTRARRLSGDPTHSARCSDSSLAVVMLGFDARPGSRFGFGGVTLDPQILQISDFDDSGWPPSSTACHSCRTHCRAWRRMVSFIARLLPLTPCSTNPDQEALSRPQRRTSHPRLRSSAPASHALQTPPIRTPPRLKSFLEKLLLRARPPFQPPSPPPMYPLNRDFDRLSRKSVLTCQPSHSSAVPPSAPNPSPPGPSSPTRTSPPSPTASAPATALTTTPSSSSNRPSPPPTALAMASASTAAPAPSSSPYRPSASTAAPRSSSLPSPFSPASPPSSTPASSPPLPTSTPTPTTSRRRPSRPPSPPAPPPS